MRVAIDAPIGGLGDSLLFSTLPKMYATRGHKVFVTPRTLDNCRNPEVADLLYFKNPFIEGSIERDEADCVAGIVHEVEFFHKARIWPNPMQLIETLHKFAPEHDRPILAYRPNRIPSWANRIAIDPSSISQGFPPHVFHQFIERMGVDLDRAFVITSKHAGANGHLTLPSVPRYEVFNIFEYIDIIHSCEAFFCTESGGQSIASAVRQRATYALCTTMMFNSRFYIWPNVNYTVTGQLSQDYLWNDTTAEQVGAWG